MKIRNNRPGPLIIADAKITLAPGEVVEIEKPTRQIEIALAQGHLGKVANATPAGAPAPQPPAPAVPSDYERLSVSEAIEYVGDEDSVDTLKAILKMEKRKDVLSAAHRRLREVKASAPK